MIVFCFDWLIQSFQKARFKQIVNVVENTVSVFPFPKFVIVRCQNSIFDKIQNPSSLNKTLSILKQV